MENRNKKITFRVNDEEYKKIVENKPQFENLSHYIRRVLINKTFEF